MHRDADASNRLIHELLSTVASPPRSVLWWPGTRFQSQFLEECEKEASSRREKISFEDMMPPSLSDEEAEGSEEGDQSDAGEDRAEGEAFWNFPLVDPAGATSQMLRGRNGAIARFSDATDVGPIIALGGLSEPEGLGPLMPFPCWRRVIRMDTRGNDMDGTLSDSSSTLICPCTMWSCSRSRSKGYPATLRSIS